EIRTPMNGVLGGVHLLLDAELGEQERRYARTIEVSGRAMVELLDDILDFARSESGHLDLELRPLDAVTEVETTVGAFSEAASARGLRLDLAIDTGPDGPSHPIVLGDAVRLRQILSNLITNALKFTPDGGVTIRLTVRSTETDATIHCVVEDTGIGIDATARERLFEPFHQGDSSTARRFGGTGLGLAICRDLLRLMGGEIGVEPGSDGLGSAFWFRVELPRCPSEVHDESPPRQPLSPRPGKILVAEDNPINRFVLVEMLEGLGHTVETADDGDAAVDRMLATSFDLVLMDCQMPGTDGFEATRRIRRLEPDRGPVIIAVTAAALDENREQCVAAGMDDFVSKPITPETLDQVLAQWLPSSKSRRTA
ncbi:MAG: ATP-binding protein, partial [Acidobacteriota bacterium]